MTVALIPIVTAATAGVAMTTAGAAPAALARSAGQAGSQARQAGSQAGQPSTRDVGGPRLAARGIVVNYPSRRSKRLPSVPASAYVIANARTGQVLAAKDAHGLFPPASTLKVLTAITTIPLLNPRATVVATRLAASVEPNVVGLVPGRRYKVADLFRALLMISANDAAVSLAQATGSFSKGIALMNAQARHLRAYDVVARQPNGLPAPGQVVSAYDLALIARKALSMPAFMRYDSTLAARFPVTKRKRVPLVNQNRLLTSYRGGLGGKIGWTMRAEATYIGMARRHGVTLIVTILHCTSLMEITSAERLLDWGFAMAGRVRPVGTLVPPLAAAPARHTSRAATPARQNSRAPSAAAPRGLGNGAAAEATGRNGSGSSLTVGAGVVAALCVTVIGRLTWRRRRSSPGGKTPG